MTVQASPVAHPASAPSGRNLIAVASGGIGRQLIISRSETVRETMGLPQPVTTVPPPGAAASFNLEGITNGMNVLPADGLQTEPADARKEGTRSRPGPDR